MNELLHAALPVAIGLLSGVPFGYAVRGLFVSRQLSRRERDTWIAATRFYRNIPRP